MLFVVPVRCTARYVQRLQNKLFVQTFSSQIIMLSAMMMMIMFRNFRMRVVFMFYEKKEKKAIRCLYTVHENLHDSYNVMISTRASNTFLMI